MSYAKSLMAKWDEYAILKTAREQDRDETVEEKNYEFVKNLLLQTDFNTAKIASLVNVDEAFVHKVKKGL